MRLSGREAARDNSADLDYFELVKAANDLSVYSPRKTIRLAVLADFATQQLIPLLQVLCARKGYRLELYEAGYDSIDVEILNPQSRLYDFKPHYVTVLLSQQKLLHRLYGSADRHRFVEETIERMTGLWATLRRNTTATVVQSNFVAPSERAFGNYELKVEDSVGSIFAEINYRLVQRCRLEHNVFLCDTDFLAAEVGRANWFDDRLWSMAKTFCRPEHMPRFAKAITDVMLSVQGAVVKCVVLDLDNTLWGGVIGDDGVGGILLGDYDEGESFVAFQKFLLELKRRGVVLAVVSKNEHAHAVLPFREHPNMVLKETDIAVFVANWNNKADNIRLVQKTLNIGFDSMVFLDDNPFERNLVRQYLPDVIVPELPEDPASYVRALADLNLFETTSYSETDKQRADLYREEAQREIVKSSFTNVSDYLQSLTMTIKLERFNRFNLPRIAQLIQRSNQFNLCTRRYSEAACEGLMTDPGSVTLTVNLSDKFGDYGLISVIILKIDGDSLVIDEYLMSCRVLQRGVEHFVMNRIVAFAQERGFRQIKGAYLRTPKNAMVKEFFSQFGFMKTAENDRGDSSWLLEVERYAPLDALMTPVVDEL